MPSEAGNSKESSGSYLFAIPVADSRYRAASAEENQAVNLNELQDLDNSFLLWKSAMTARDNLYDAVKDLEAAEQYKNGLRDISDISSGNLKEILYGRSGEAGTDRLLPGQSRKLNRKRNNFSDCFWKYCV
ncbi:uncharacterized protein LOC132382172 isoform X2 [Hypanus sabinus]|uniref:uncharacterized protein LOC132382172 isoform X2 n=1 Tax=Hypanus sabinus TaxID=79690 RepID=UPI0028C3E7A1|nr:uncharacterized protein LOC132382172 isoform X2 [Hypanus sabinus]